jgi:hypothetical protein
MRVGHRNLQPCSYRCYCDDLTERKRRETFANLNFTPFFCLRVKVDEDPNGTPTVRLLQKQKKKEQYCTMNQINPPLYIFPSPTSAKNLIDGPEPTEKHTAALPRASTVNVRQLTRRWGPTCIQIDGEAGIHPQAAAVGLEARDPAFSNIIASIRHLCASSLVMIQHFLSSPVSSRHCKLRCW